MNAKALVKKLGNKLLGKKVKTPGVVQVSLDEKAPAVRLLDQLGVIQLHENWRN